MRVLTIGTFDLFHAGHVRLFKKSAEYGELTVGVNSDEFVTSYKGSPVIPYELRREVVEAIGCVSDVVPNDGSGTDLIRSVKPDILAIGPDWLDRDYLTQIGMTQDELFGDLGVTLAFIPPARVPGLSASEIRDRLCLTNLLEPSL